VIKYDIGDDMSINIENEIKNLTKWRIVKDNNLIFIKKKFTFVNFIDAFGWMQEIALIAEEINHHPNWLNIYSTVEVTLYTHTLKQVTELDIKLAKIMDEKFKNYAKED